MRRKFRAISLISVRKSISVQGDDDEPDLTIWHQLSAPRTRA